MQFNLVALAIFAAAGAAMARPSDNAVAGAKTTNDQSAALRFLLTNSPAGHQAEEDGPAPPGCYWDGTAPFCAGSCPTGYTEEGRGSCGDGACCWTGYKFLCCKTPDSGDS
ncbi:hypothetical protein CPC08DRAFT_761451 [Agrocybe pediades]|nr:hypothetical protein CPC08DRAFT_761451 [Agrocybe pediades]